MAEEKTNINDQAKKNTTDLGMEQEHKNQDHHEKYFFRNISCPSSFAYKKCRKQKQFGQNIVMRYTSCFKKTNRKAWRAQSIWAEREWVGCISCLPKALTLKLLAQLTHHCFQLDLLDVLFQISNRQGILWSWAEVPV